MPASRYGGIIVWLLVFLVPLTGSEPRGPGKRGCIRWVRNFEGVKSEHVDRKCNILDDNTPVCCAARGQRNSNAEPRGVGEEHLVAKDELIELNGRCSIERTYKPSPYEIRHLEFAATLMSISDASQRLESLLRFLTTPAEIAHNYEWLHYAKVLMQGGHIEEGERARLVLSHFEVTRACRQPGGGVTSSSWREWIEPLSVHGRHPFAFASCRHIDAVARAYPQRGGADRGGLEDVSGGAGRGSSGEVKAVSIMNVDYLVLLSNKMMHNLNGSTPGVYMEEIYESKQGAGGEAGSRRLRPFNRHLLLDAGTSYFQSSLSWLTCAYSQVDCLLVMAMCVSVYLCGWV